MATRWQDRAKVVLERVSGLRVSRQPAWQVRGRVRPSPHPELDRLLPSPVFLLSSVRSGSTLLRVILNSHSRIHAPHETHFRRLTVVPSTPPALQALEVSGLNVLDVEHLLWDRLLHRSLQLSGKDVLVEKTPSNVFAADRLAVAWPKARFIYLIRHPLAVARSWHAANPEQRPMDRAVTHTLGYMQEVERARERHPGLTLRYEDLVAEPTSATRQICAHLGVAWEPEMLEYGRHDHGPLVAGIGDWSPTIRGGEIRPARPLPNAAELPADLHRLAAAWGYA